MVSVASYGDGDCVSCYVDEIMDCYYKLSQSPDLKPSPSINCLFERLIGLCGQIPNEAITAKILSDPKVVDIAPHLRKLCSDGEYQLEAHWARKVCCCKTHEEANEMLLTFPYHGNYVDLVRMEMNAIASVKPDFATRTFAFLGSGPLPLTSLCISHHLKSECVTCHNVDQDATAIATAITLCRALGHPPETMCFQCASAGSPDVDLGRFDIVYLAALVGDCSRDKHEIVAEVVKRMKPGALVVMRSAHSLRRLLYPVVEFTEDMASVGLRPVLVVHPYNHVINSVVIAVVESPCH